VADAFLLAGGADLALAVSSQLGAMVRSAGCTATLAATLAVAGEAAAAQQAALHVPAMPTFGLAAAQMPSVAACWLTAGGQLAATTLASISPTLVVGAQGEQQPQTPVMG